jgi:hypothetical protein
MVYGHAKFAPTKKKWKIGLTSENRRRVSSVSFSLQRKSLFSEAFRTWMYTGTCNIGMWFPDVFSGLQNGVFDHWSCPILATSCVQSSCFSDRETCVKLAVLTTSQSPSPPMQCLSHLFCVFKGKRAQKRGSSCFRMEVHVPKRELLSLLSWSDWQVGVTKQGR